MANVFQRIDQMLGDVVELFCVNGLWSVRVIESGSGSVSAFSVEAEAIHYAEAEVKRLGLRSFIRL